MAKEVKTYKGEKKKWEAQMRKLYPRKSDIDLDTGRTVFIGFSKRQWNQSANRLTMLQPTLQRT